jgi:hypothetical protein
MRKVEAHKIKIDSQKAVMGRLLRNFLVCFKVFMSIKISIITNINQARTIELENFADLQDIILKDDWSPYTFANGRRITADFIGGDVFAIDIDNGMSLADAEAKVRELNLKAIIATSKSHGVEKRGVVADRYRIVFALSRPLATVEGVKACFFGLREHFPTLDEACKDGARYFYPCTTVTFANLEGVPFQVPTSVPALTHSAPSSVVNDGKVYPLSEKTLNFIKMGAKEGERNNPFVAACHDAIQQQWPIELFKDFLRTKGRPWMLSSDYMDKIEERYKNFTPTHEPRRGDLPANPQTGKVDKTQLIPVSMTSGMLKKWIRDNDVKCTYSGTVLINGVQCIVPDIINKFRLHCADYNLVFSDAVVEAFLQEWVIEARETHKRLIAATVCGPSNVTEGTAELRRFLSVLRTETTDLDVAVFRHMLWQVKRKISGLPCAYEMMCVLSGGQGAGKSLALQDFLFSPIKDLCYTNAEFGLLRDERQGRIFSDHYIVLFDEMAGADRGDIDRIKQMITARTFKQRRMGTTSHDVLLMNATFFGTTNKELETIIRDNTGMRRFYEFKVDTRAETMPKWPILKELDYALIWASVDHAIESPLTEHYDTLMIEQKKLEEVQLVDYLVKEDALTLDETACTPFLVVMQFLNEVSGYKKSPQYWGRELKKHFKQIRKMDGRYYPIKINRGSSDF